MTRSGWKYLWTVGLTVLCLPLLLAACFFLWFSKVNYPDPVAASDMNAVRHFTGLVFPTSARLIEGYSWEPWLFAARIEIPKKDLPRFLAQHNFDRLVERDEESNIFEDRCATQKDERAKIARWKLRGYRHSLLLRSSQDCLPLQLGVGWPTKRVGRYCGYVSFLVGLDDPHIATVYLSWDCRGGFAC
jgi:hypothetical protein